MVLFISGFVAMEIAICTIIVLTVPGGSLMEVQYSEMKNEAFAQCTFAQHSQVHIALWWCYNTGIVLVCTYQAYLTRKVPGNRAGPWKGAGEWGCTYQAYLTRKVPGNR